MAAKFAERSCLLQVGHKSFMYMHLYAESTLALVETPYQEIQFKQIVGDFQTLQGKIMIQEDSLDKVSTNIQDCCHLYLVKSRSD